MTMTSTEVRNRWAGCAEGAVEIPMHTPMNRQSRTDILPLCRKSPSDSRAGPQGLGDVDNHFVRVDLDAVSDRIVRRQLPLFYRGCEVDLMCAGLVVLVAASLSSQVERLWTISDLVTESDLVRC